MQYDQGLLRSMESEIASLKVSTLSSHSSLLMFDHLCTVDFYFIDVSVRPANLLTILYLSVLQHLVYGMLCGFWGGVIFVGTLASQFPYCAYFWKFG